jgi:peroxiredoxin (alkyl hydroperoxide reductase subunit C)
MMPMKKFLRINLFPSLVLIFLVATVFSASEAFKDNIYDPGKLKPVDSTLKVKIGEPAPDFALPSVSGEKISLSQYRGKKMWSSRLSPQPGRLCVPISGRVITS